MPPRRTFALTGPSRPLDPQTNAVRRDIADVRLADRVFAPHYAASVARVVARDTPLVDGPTDAAMTLVTLAPGDPFELLDVTGQTAWGIAPVAGLVGYLPIAALRGSAG